MFSPRGFKVYMALMIPVIAYMLYERFTDSGIVAALDAWQAERSDDGSYTPFFSFLGAAFVGVPPAMALALLHDFVCRMGLFLPKSKRDEFPHLATLWEQNKRKAKTWLPASKTPAGLRCKRIRYALASLFAPVGTVIAFVFVALALGAEKPDASIAIGAILLGFVLGMTIRLYFAGRYVDTKARARAWRFLALAGIWGWIVLFMLEDRPSAYEVDPDAFA